MQKDGSYPNECDKEDTFKAGNMKWSSPLVLKKDKGSTAIFRGQRRIQGE